ncbi:MAG: hypothetical protein GY725_22930, partial [bacterium]|nr:hypothetical protein [bacterium]
TLTVRVNAKRLKVYEQILFERGKTMSEEIRKHMDGVIERAEQSGE